MDLGIAGKVALVSGGTKGIGRAVSVQLAREGCLVAVVARGQQAIDETVDVICKAGGTAIGISADLYSHAGISQAIEATTAAFGSPDIVITNVYGPGPGNFFDVSVDDFASAFSDMTLSIVHMVRAVLPHMKEKRWGRVVNIGSHAAKEPPVHKHILANTVRSSVVTLNKTLADEFGPYGITFNTIGTGYIDTSDRFHNYMAKMAEEKGISKEKFLEDFFHEIPARRLGTPEEAASMITYLCSQGAAYVTGNILPVDGGWHRSAW